MTDLRSQLCAVVREVDCDPEGKAKLVLEPGHAIEGHLLTDDVDVRCIGCLQRQAASRAKSPGVACSLLSSVSSSVTEQDVSVRCRLVCSCVEGDNLLDNKRKDNILKPEDSVMEACLANFEADLKTVNTQ